MKRFSFLSSLMLASLFIGMAGCHHTTKVYEDDRHHRDHDWDDNHRGHDHDWDDHHRYHDDDR